MPPCTCTCTCKAETGVALYYTFSGRRITVTKKDLPEFLSKRSPDGSPVLTLRNPGYKIEENPYY